MACSTFTKRPASDKLDYDKAIYEFTELSNKLEQLFIGTLTMEAHSHLTNVDGDLEVLVFLEDDREVTFSLKAMIDQDIDDGNFSASELYEIFSKMAADIKVKIDEDKDDD